MLTAHDSLLTQSASMTIPRRALRIGIVAGETSGDNLGAAFMLALREIHPDAQFFGIAGPRMAAAGCEQWEPSETLAVMGLFEGVTHLPRLLALRRRIRSRMVAAQAGVFICV